MHTPNSILLSRLVKYKTINTDFVPQINITINNTEILQKLTKVKNSQVFTSKLSNLIPLKSNIKELGTKSKSLDEIITDIDAAQKVQDIENTINNNKILLFVVAFVIGYLIFYFVIMYVRRKLRSCLIGETTARVNFISNNRRYEEREI